MSKRRPFAWPYSVQIDHANAVHAAFLPPSMEVDDGVLAEIEENEGKPSRPFMAVVPPHGAVGMTTMLTNGSGEHLTVGDVFGFHRRLEEWAAAEVGSHQFLYPDCWTDPHFAQFQSEPDMRKFIAAWGGTVRQPTRAERNACLTPQQISALGRNMKMAQEINPIPRVAMLHTVVFDGGVIRRPRPH